MNNGTLHTTTEHVQIEQTIIRIQSIMTTKEETQSKIGSEGEQKDKVATNHHVVGGRGRAGEVVDADHGACFTVELVDYIRGLLQQVVVVPQEVSPHLPSHGLIISSHAKTTGTQPQPRARVGQINPRADDDVSRRGGVAGGIQGIGFCVA